MAIGTVYSTPGRRHYDHGSANLNHEIELLWLGLRRVLTQAGAAEEEEEEPTAPAPLPPDDQNGDPPNPGDDDDEPPTTTTIIIQGTPGPEGDPGPAGADGAGGINVWNFRQNHTTPTGPTGGLHVYAAGDLGTASLALAALPLDPSPDYLHLLPFPVSRDITGKRFGVFGFRSGGTNPQIAVGIYDSVSETHQRPRNLLQSILLTDVGTAPDWVLGIVPYSFLGGRLYWLAVTTHIDPDVFGNPGSIALMHYGSFDGLYPILGWGVEFQAITKQGYGFKYRFAEGVLPATIPTISEAGYGSTFEINPTTSGAPPMIFADFND